MAYRFPAYNPNAARDHGQLASYPTWQPPDYNGHQLANEDGNGHWIPSSAPMHHAFPHGGNYPAQPFQGGYPAYNDGRGGGGGDGRGGGHRFNGRGRRPNGRGRPMQHNTNRPRPDQRGPVDGTVPADHNEDGSFSESTYSCLPCQKNFTCEKDLLAHQSTHVQCQFEGCSFVAAKKIVTLHFIKNHEEGKFKINLDTPEEIAQWREQRKRCFPTKDNIAKKIDLKEQRQKNGISTKTKSFRYRNQQCVRCCGRFPKRGRRGRGRGGKDDSGCSCWRSGISPDDYEQLVSAQDSQQAGTAVASDAPSQTAQQHDSEASGTGAQKAGGLGLLASYDSGGESSSNDDKDVTTPVTTLSTQSMDKPNLPAVKPPQTKRKYQERQPRRRNQQQPTKKTKHGNLLEMLLAKDIRHERNAILQCVRYIVQKDFFNVEQNVEVSK